MEIGKKLQEERLAKGLSLEDVKNETKIQSRYLAAIEENDWKNMPGNFYVRAFIREYAQVLGLDAAALLEEHKNELPQIDEAAYEYTSPSRSNRGSKKGNSAFFSFFPKLLVFILVIGIIFGIWYSYVNYWHPGLTDNEENNGDEAGEELIAPDPEEDEDESTDEEDSSEEENNNEESEEDNTEEETTEPSLAVESVDADAATPLTTVQLENADALEFTFETDSEVYLGVNGENESYYEQMFYADDSPLEVDASESNSIELNVGDASALTFAISGVEFEYEIDPEEEVHQKIHVLWNSEDES